jgi:hypothetical protein
MKAAGFIIRLTLVCALWIPSAYSQQPAQAGIGVLRLSSSTPSSGNQQLQLFNFTGPTNCDQVTYTVCDNLTITNWTLVVKYTDLTGSHTSTFTDTGSDNIAPHDNLLGPYTGQVNNPWTFDESCTSGTCPPFDTVITQVTFTGTIGSSNPTVLNVKSSGSTSSFFASPTITVQYTPQIASSDSGVVVYDPIPLQVNAAVSPALQLSATGLDLGHVWVYQSGQSSSVTITNAGTASLHIQNIVTTPSSFTDQLGSCALAVAPGATCTFSVAFKPGAQGPATGTIAIYSDAPGSPHSLSVSGQGIDLALTLTRPTRPTRSGANLVKVGEAAEFQVELSSNAIGEPVSLFCSNPPPGTTCSVNPSQLLLSGRSDTVTVVLAKGSAVSGQRPSAATTPEGMYTMTVTARTAGGSRSIALPVQVASQDETANSAGSPAQRLPASTAAPAGQSDQPPPPTVAVVPTPPALSGPDAVAGRSPQELTLELHSDKSLTRPGDLVTFVATLKSVGDSAHGEVVFHSGDQLLGKATLDEKGIATFTTSLLPVGKHSITATYAAGPGSPEVSSPAVVHTVQTSTTGAPPANANKGKERE